MAIGGGTFLAQNKALPGTFINFVSAASASVALSDRGYVAMALPLPWGPCGEVITVTGEDLIRRSRRIFGREYTHPDLKPLRELFAGARVAHLFRLGASGTRADSALGQGAAFRQSGQSDHLSGDPERGEFRCGDPGGRGRRGFSDSGRCGGAPGQRLRFI